jgi:hypothetical protein
MKQLFKMTFLNIYARGGFAYTQLLHSLPSTELQWRLTLKDTRNDVTDCIH